MCVSWSQPGYFVFDPAAFAVMVSAWKSFALFSQQHKHVSSLSSEKLPQAYYLKSYRVFTHTCVRSVSQPQAAVYRMLWVYSKTAGLHFVLQYLHIPRVESCCTECPFNIPLSSRSTLGWNFLRASKLQTDLSDSGRVSETPGFWCELHVLSTWLGLLGLPSYKEVRDTSLTSQLTNAGSCSEYVVE